MGRPMRLELTRVGLLVPIMYLYKSSNRHSLRIAFAENKLVKHIYQCLFIDFFILIYIHIYILAAFLQ